MLLREMFKLPPLKRCFRVPEAGEAIFYPWIITLGPVVRRPINANPRLKVNRGFHLACLKWVERSASS